MKHRQDAGATVKHRQDAGATVKHRQDAGATVKHRQDAGATVKHRQDAGATVVALALVFSCASAFAGLEILPGTVALTGPEASQRIVVTQVVDGYAGRPEAVEFSSSEPGVAAVDADGVVVAKSDGKAVITARSKDGEAAKVEVSVRGSSGEPVWSFRNHVLPVVSKAGCNTGGCHGALAGKGGFRLSLDAYAPVEDFETITRGARGRRVEMADPARSLLLTKPTAAASHKGGKRLQPESRDYRILADWIAAGAAAPTDEDARIERIEILPRLSLLAPGDSQRLIVRAFYSDGREEDVTSWAKFASSDEAVARVDKDSGEVTVTGPGEGAVTAWFSSQIVMARVTVPYANEIPDRVFAVAPRRNVIDEKVIEQLERLNLKPSPRATDGEFLRRAYVDTIGVLPTPAETIAFLESEEPVQKKRDRVIEALLGRPEFVDYWSYRWSDLFLVNGRYLRPDAVNAYYAWLRGKVEKNTPWDELARELVTAKGGSLEDGATNFFGVHQDPEQMAENVSQTFMALSIGCAKCHNHPLEKWTNDQYYSFANLFARVRAKGWGGDPRNGDGLRTLFVEEHGDLIQPRTGVAQPPAPLDGEEIPTEDRGDRREVLAEWLTSQENPYFTKAIANRVWAAFFGRGIVDPVDDLRVSNPASNEPLLEALAAFVAEADYDLKDLMRMILQSETYQRSSVPLAENREEDRYFSRYYPRRMMAEVLHDAVAGITEVPGEFNFVGANDGSKSKTEIYPEGTRALQLRDSAVESYFLKIFGRNDRAIACECERSNQPSMVQVLHLVNGDTMNEKLRKEGSFVTELMEGDFSDAEVIEAAYLACLSREPTEKERVGFEKIFAETPEEERRVVVEDLMWALMTSREFLFQH